MLFLDVNVHDLIKGASSKLESNEKISAPDWALYVKTGSHKKRAPIQADWWTLRSAALLRTVALMGPIGTNKLRVKYGGRKDRGKKPSKFCVAGGSVIRNSLQQLEAAGLIEQREIGAHKGRVATTEGLRLLNAVAKELKAAKKAEEPEAKTPVKKAPVKKAAKKEDAPVKAEEPKEAPAKIVEAKVEAPVKEEVKAEAKVAEAEEAK